MGDRLRAGKLSRYVTSHPGQLSLAISPWVGKMITSLGWEGNHRSGVALAMHHRRQWFIHLRAQRLMKGRWAPRLRSFGVWSSFTTPVWRVCVLLTHLLVRCKCNWIQQQYKTANGECHAFGRSSYRKSVISPSVECDCMRNADKSPNVPDSAMVRSGKVIRNPYPGPDRYQNLISSSDW